MEENPVSATITSYLSIPVPRDIRNLLTVRLVAVQYDTKISLLHPSTIWSNQRNWKKVGLPMRAEVDGADVNF